MTFHVGQRVVCVESGNYSKEYDIPVVGCVYVVRGILPSPFPRDSNQLGLYLDGMYAGHGRLLEYAYKAVHFRPLQETGMSILRAIAANPKRELETVE